MMVSWEQGGYPSPRELQPVFDVTDVREDGDKILYVGELAATKDEAEERIAGAFQDEAYTVDVRANYEAINGLPNVEDKYVVIAEPEETETSTGYINWSLVLTVGSFAITLLTTLVAGLTWYDLTTDQNIWNMVYVWPYAASVLGVLTAHELGHYYMAKRHGVDVSTPVYIPFPFFVGTVGAYVDIKDDIPDRKALFDIGIAGPITGIVAAVFAAAIGFHLEPVIHTSGSEPGSIWVSFVDPPLVNLVGDAMHALTGTQVHFEGRAISRSPVVFGAWIGTFVTFLNLMPAGQLDGGHITRSMLGEKAKWVGLLAPAALVALGGWMFTQGKEPIARFWWFWALFILYYWYKGTVTPTRETGTIGRKRLAVLAGVIVVGALCFTPTPIDVTTVPPAVP